MKTFVQAQARVTHRTFPVSVFMVAALAALLLVLSWAVLWLVLPRAAHANGVGTIFVANEGGNSVSVLEHVGNTVLATIPVGDAPQAVAFTRDGRFAQVANRGGTLSVIDRDLYETTATIRVEGAHSDVVSPADTTLSVVADAGNNRLIVVDSAGAVVRTIPTPGRPVAMASDRSGRKVYVSIGGTEGVSVFDAVTGGSIGTVAVGSTPGNLTLSPDGSQLFVSLPSVGSVAVVDTSDNRVVGTVATGANPAGSAVSRDGSKLFVANAGANTVSVVEVSPRRVVETIPVGANPRDVALSPDGGPFAYVANAGGNSVSVIDVARNAVVKTVPVGQSPVAVNVASVPPGPGTLPSPGGTSSAGQGGVSLGQGGMQGSTAQPVTSTSGDASASQPAPPVARTGGTQQGGVSVVPRELPNTGAAASTAKGILGGTPVALITFGTGSLAAAVLISYSRKRRHAQTGRQ